MNDRGIFKIEKNENALDATRTVLQIGNTKDDKCLFDFVKIKTRNFEGV